MNTQSLIPDIEKIRSDLKALASSEPGALTRIARDSGLTHSLLWRFMEKSGMNELGYSKVRQLLPHLYGKNQEIQEPRQ